jgi:hypothetical protein
LLLQAFFVAVRGDLRDGKVSSAEHVFVFLFICAEITTGNCANLVKLILPRIFSFYRHLMLV